MSVDLTKSLFFVKIILKNDTGSAANSHIKTPDKYLNFKNEPSNVHDFPRSFLDFVFEPLAGFFRIFGKFNHQKKLLT